MDFNPWHVESIEAFNFYCCPECVYRVQEEFAFQAHAIQNHAQSKTLFDEVPTKFENCVSSPEPGIEVKVELGGDKIECFGDEGNEENGDFEEADFPDQGNKYYAQRSWGKCIRLTENLFYLFFRGHPGI